MTVSDKPHNGREALEIMRVVHDYSGVVVLRDVSFVMRPGSVHGLIGENGCGKSTLIKVITGAVQARAGTFTLGGRPLQLGSPQRAQRIGIGVVHQDYNLFPKLSVASNVAGVSSAPRRFGFVDHRRMHRMVASLLAALGIDIPTRTLVGELGPAERKFVEIARAMRLDPRFLILDEPTASLEPQAARLVLNLLARLRDQGVGLAFVSHRLDEVLQICDEITVLRDGRVVLAAPNKELTESHLVEAMVGREHVRDDVQPHEPVESRGVALRVTGVSLARSAHPVELDLRDGEVLGLTGLLGSGASDLVGIVGGAIPLSSGTIEVHGKRVRIRGPRDAVRAGIGFAPEDRKAEGIILDHSVQVNVSLASLGGVSRWGILRPGAMRSRAEEYRDSVRIKAPAVTAPVRTLSGGNQQKVMIAKLLASGARVLALQEPTHGVDVGGKAQIHDLLRDFARQGGAVMIASTDLREILEVCDRIAIFRHGVVSGVVARDAITHSELVVAGARDPESILDQLVSTDRAAADVA